MDILSLLNDFLSLIIVSFLLYFGLKIQILHTTFRNHRHCISQNHNQAKTSLEKRSINGAF